VYSKSSLMRLLRVSMFTLQLGHLIGLLMNPSPVS
jgi:hypothetical protein